ncbi:MAG: sulfatase, partial [Thalassobius sp.]|nr:sulfatase [Thalassovita sp.]
MKIKLLLATLLLSITFSCEKKKAEIENETSKHHEVSSEEREPDHTNKLISQEPVGNAPEGMVWIPGGEFIMGSNHESAGPAEMNEHKVKVFSFWMDETEVTNAEFRKFIEATGYVTVAERPIDWEEMKKQLPPNTPKPDDEVLKPGSLVFTPPANPVSLHDYSQWWSWVHGADWKHPKGPDSSIEGKDNYPVVHIAYEDAEAYA